jgi:hypothetical protein
METRHAVEMHKIDSGFFGPVAENLFCRRGWRGEPNPAAESRGSSQLYEVAPIDAIPHSSIGSHANAQYESGRRIAGKF